VTVFIDYQNVHGWARRQFHALGNDPATSGHVDPYKLGKLLVARRNYPSTLEQVRVYRGRPGPDRQATATAANDRQTANWERNRKVIAIRRPLRYPNDWPDSPATEKGIDVAIAVDLVRLAMEQRYDVAILVSADTDLMPAAETIVDLRLAHIEVASWTGGHRLRFPGSQKPWCHYLAQAEYDQVRDHTDYRIP
jgi:hypothetical protein